jgi:phosphoserine phosphatase
MMILKVMGICFVIIGAVITFLTKYIVRKYQIDARMTCDFENELNEKELAQYKFDKAVVNIKIIGMIVIFPGILLSLYSYS